MCTALRLIASVGVDINNLIELPSLNFLYPTRNWINTLTNEVVRLHLIKGSWCVTGANRRCFINGEVVFNPWDINLLAFNVLKLNYVTSAYGGYSITDELKNQRLILEPNVKISYLTVKGSLVYHYTTGEYELTLNGETKIFPCNGNTEEMLITLLTHL